MARNRVGKGYQVGQRPLRITPKTLFLRYCATHSRYSRNHDAGTTAKLVPYLTVFLILFLSYPVRRLFLDSNLNTRIAQRIAFVRALKEMDAYWLNFLEEQDFYDLNYYDLFTGLWLRGEPVTKTEAGQFIKHLGAQTAKKYINRAVSMGYLEELENPADKRSRLIALSHRLEKGLTNFFDHTIESFKQVLI